MDENEDRADKPLDAIWGRVCERVGPKCIVDYSAYHDDENEVPIDNLDEVPIAGKVRIRMEKNGWRIRDYESPLLESPTWLDLCVHANDMIRKTRDRHHVFLEGVEVIGHDGDVQIARFWMGS